MTTPTTNIGQSPNSVFLAFVHCYAPTLARCALTRTPGRGDSPFHSACGWATPFAAQWRTGATQRSVPTNIGFIARRAARCQNVRCISLPVRNVNYTRARGLDPLCHADKPCVKLHSRRYRCDVDAWAEQLRFACLTRAYLAYAAYHL